MIKVELKPIPDDPSEWDALEKRLKKYFRDLLYLPLLRKIGLPKKTITNDTNHSDPVMEALFTTRVTYSKGVFSGKFSAEISKRLRDLGAKFDKKNSTYKLPYSKLSLEMKNVIRASESRVKEKLFQLDATLSKIVPEEFAKQFKCEDLFERNMWKADKSFRKNVKNITVVPEFTETQKKVIASQWQNNMELWIQRWTEEEIKRFRTEIKDSIFEGTRYDSLSSTIQKMPTFMRKSYEKAAKKAKFLASQETRLLMTAYKQEKYESAGSKSYVWRCVHRSHDSSPDKHTPGNVRYTHGLLEGKEIQWNDPPVTSNPGEKVRRNHAGQDYNCRCYSRPIVRQK